MQKEIKINNKNIKYTLKVSNRARGVRLAIYHDGTFIVTIPNKIKEGLVENFIIKKSRWIIEKIEYFEKNPRTILIKHTNKEIKEHKEKAKKLTISRLQYFNQFYNFKWNNISIKNTKSRWGSCSKRGNLNFNYKITLLPQHLSDYIVVHELCHLGELNHSSNFWKLVEKTIPHHKEIRKQLKTICL